MLCLVKTHPALFERLRDRILQLHPYDVPEILAFKVHDGSQAYIDWLHGSSPSRKGARDDRRPSDRPPAAPAPGAPRPRRRRPGRRAPGPTRPGSAAASGSFRATSTASGA